MFRAFQPNTKIASKVIVAINKTTLPISILALVLSVSSIWFLSPLKLNKILEPSLDQEIDSLQRYQQCL
jgi:hypothetical protein